MKFLLIIYYLPHCFISVHSFPAVPRISADVAFSHQTEELRKCIRDTTDHYIEQIISMGGSSSDRLPFSISQIQQLCIATSGQISDTPSNLQPPQFITTLSTYRSTTFVQPAIVTLSPILVKTSGSATMTTPIQGTTVSTSPSTSTVAISTTQSSQTTITEQTAVMFGPHLPPTSSAADLERRRKKNLKDLNIFTIIMQILTLG
jgi:hypothetical protein